MMAAPPSLLCRHCQCQPMCHLCRPLQHTKFVSRYVDKVGVDEQFLKDIRLFIRLQSLLALPCVDTAISVALRVCQPHLRDKTWHRVINWCQVRTVCLILFVADSLEIEVDDENVHVLLLFEMVFLRLV